LHTTLHSISGNLASQKPSFPKLSPFIEALPRLAAGVAGGSIMAEEKTQNEIALYIAADGSMQIDVRIAAETVWLTQRQMAELFDTSIDNIP
jgi:hypothetical protein